MTKKLEPMSPDQIEASIQEWVSDAQTYMDSELSPARATATEYYQGKKFGNEEQGRSQFVLTDVRDTVLAMLPSLVRLFLPTSGHVIEYQARPKTLGDVQQSVLMAEQATEFINGVVLDQDNDGFLEIHAAFKDALIRAVGWIKWWWEDRSQYQAYTAEHLTVTDYESLIQDPDVEPTKVAETKDPSGLPLYSVSYKHWRREGVAKIACVPPEEVLFSRDARSRSDALFFAHRTEKTKSELLAMGVPESEIDDYGGASSEVRQSIEEIARRGGVSHMDNAPNEASKRHLWIEAYPYLDVDGDGVAELVRVHCIGPGCHVVGDPEPVDERPFALFCPDPEPHVLVGQSVAQRVMDLQLMKSSLVREAADGLSETVHPREYYMEGVVDRQAMESTAMGQKVAVTDGVRPAEAILVVNKEWKGQDILNFLGYFDAVKQQRIGPLPATLDPDALQSTPEVGVKATVQAASEQLELIARVFAATGMKQLGRGLLRLLHDEQPRARIARLRGQYVPVDPRAWDAEMDVSVHVAIGTQEKLGVLAATAMKQEQALQLLGPTNPALTIGQLLHTYRTMLQLQGIPDVDRFWNNVPLNWQPPPQPQQADPNQLIAQAEIAKAQSKVAADQAKIEQDRVKLMQEQQKVQSEQTARLADLSLQREAMHLTDERERDKTEADIALRVQEMNAKYNAAVTIEELNAQIAREKMATDALSAREAAAVGNGKPKKKKMTMERSDGRKMTVHIEGE